MQHFELQQEEFFLRWVPLKEVSYCCCKLLL